MNDHVVNAGLVVVSVLLVLAGLEAALAVGVVNAQANWVDYQQRPCENLDGEDPIEYHPEYGWTSRPDAVFYRKGSPAQEWERHAIDDEGFRDTYDTGDQGVVVLGDSFTYGYLASNDEAYPNRLDRWNPNVTVHNYGTGAYGPQQYYLVYEDKAEEVDHDLVVVGYYLGNDMRDTLSRTPPPRPLFDVSNGELRQVREPERGREVENPGRKEFSAERALAVTSALLDGIDRIATENDARVLVVTIPHKREVGAGEVPRYAKQREAIDRFADDEANVHTLHTKPVLAREQRNGRQVYGIYDTHLDDDGYYVVARTIQSWLVEHDDETGLAVAETPEESTPDPGVVSSLAGTLRYHTESYGFLADRSRLLSHGVEMRLGSGVSDANPCE